LYIAVCDVNLLDRTSILQHINKMDFIKKSEGFSDPSKLLKKLHSRSYDAIFLDIPSINGIEFAKKIRQLDSEVFIVFITETDKFVHEAFSLYATDYMLKPFKADRLRKTLHYMYDKINRSNNRVMEIQTEDAYHYIKQNRILFFQETDSNCIIHTELSEFKVNSPLKNYEHLFDDEIFIKSHSKYIVNKQKISHIALSKTPSFTVHFNNSTKTALVSKDKRNRLIGL